MISDQPRATSLAGAIAQLIDYLLPRPDEYLSVREAGRLADSWLIEWRLVARALEKGQSVVLTQTGVAPPETLSAMVFTRGWEPILLTRIQTAPDRWEYSGTVQHPTMVQVMELDGEWGRIDVPILEPAYMAAQLHGWGQEPMQRWVDVSVRTRDFVHGVSQTMTGGPGDMGRRETGWNYYVVDWLRLRLAEIQKGAPVAPDLTTRD